MKIEESKWVDVSTRSDEACGRTRFVKTFGVDGGHGRVAQIELVGEDGAPPPPEGIFTYALYEWLRTT